MIRIRVVVVVMAAIISLSGPSQSGQAQQGIDPEFLKAVQGRWVSRFPSEDTVIEINGTEVRVVVPKRRANDKAAAGTLVGVITAVTKRTETKSLVDGRTLVEYDFKARTWTTSGGGRWFLSDDSYNANFRIFTSFCEVSPSVQSKPYANYAHLGSMWIGDAVREEQKRATYRPGATHYADVIVRKCSDVMPEQRRGTSGTSSSRAPAAAAVTASRPNGTAVPVTAGPPASVPVTSAQELAEIATRERLNREQAAFAAKQVADNAAAKAAFDKATADRAATIAAQKAEADRKQREYDAAMAKWRADVEACQKGDVSRCAPWRRQDQSNCFMQPYEQ